MSKELPSIEDFANNNNLPSVNEVIKEEVENQLPSVEDYVEKEEIEEIVEESVAEETESLTDLTEIIRLINDVRKDIPEIPEVKYYDDELERLCEIVDQVRSEVIDSKYYDKELERLQKNIQEVRSEIPIFPKWINEVNNIPDFSWIGKTITILDSKTSSIEDDFTKVNDSIETLRERIEINIKEVIEENDVKHFENKVEIRSEIKDLEEKYKELKEKIWKELGDTSLKIWEYHKEFKDDDRKLKKQIFGEYNSLKNNLEEKIKEFNDNSVKTDELLLNYFKNLKEEVLNLPEVKYYDNQIDEVNNKIENLDDRLLSLNELYDIVESIKSSQTELKEQLLTQPPSIDNEDSLTPLNQNFATFEDLSSHYRLFINRIQQQLATIGGGGETRLKYLDDIVGIATNPSVYDGKFLKYDHSSGKFEFSQTVATGVAEDSIIYVAKNGDDSNAGTLTEPKLTIKSAVDSIVSAGTTDKVVRVAPGTYIENNPIILPDEVTVIGHSLRENTIIPLNDDKDLFYVGNGNYIAEMSFRGSMPGKAIVAFDPEKPRYINQSPYIQNCTNFIPDSIGLKIDGNAAIGPLKSMVLDSYTQYNQGGIGASITNQGYAQLVSMFTICNEEAIVCASGGACDLTNSNSSFGTKGLVADGVSGKKYTGIVTTAAAALSDKFEVDLSTSTLSVSTATYTASTGEIIITTTTDHDFNVGMGVTISGLVMNCGGSNTDTFPSGKNGYVFNVTEVVSSTQFKTFVGVSTLNHYYESGGTVKTEVVRPYDGQAIYFNDLYNTVKTITITDGGSGYTSAPIVTVSSPSVSWGIAAKAIATIENGSVTSVDMLSNGRGYETTPTVTIAAPSSGINTATGIAVLEPEYYTVKESTEISSGISTVTINENVPYAVGVGTTVNFFKQSRILATGHSFEFIGSGTEIANSIPFNGGNPPIPENEVINTQGGLVIHTSTNQSGNFKIGDGVTINQNTSSITGQAYEKSLVSTITPYILSLGAL